MYVLHKAKHVLFGAMFVLHRQKHIMQRALRNLHKALHNLQRALRNMQTTIRYIVFDCISTTYKIHTKNRVENPYIGWDFSIKPEMPGVMRFLTAFIASFS